MPNNRNNVVKSAGRPPDAWSRSSIKYQPKPNANTGFTPSGHLVKDTKPIKLFDINEGRQTGMNFNTSNAKFLGGVMAFGAFMSTIKTANGAYWGSASCTSPVTNVAGNVVPSETGNTCTSIRNAYASSADCVNPWRFKTTISANLQCNWNAGTGNPFIDCHHQTTGYCHSGQSYDISPSNCKQTAYNGDCDTTNGFSLPSGSQTEAAVYAATAQKTLWVKPRVNYCADSSCDWSQPTANDGIYMGTTDANALCTAVKARCDDLAIMDASLAVFDEFGNAACPAQVDANGDPAPRTEVFSYTQFDGTVSQAIRCKPTPTTQTPTTEAPTTEITTEVTTQPPTTELTTQPTTEAITSVTNATTQPTEITTQEPTTHLPIAPTLESNETFTAPDTPDTPDTQGLPTQPSADGGGNNGGAAAGGVVAGLTALGAGGAAAGAIIHHRNKKKNRVLDEPITLRQLEARVKAAQLPTIEEEVVSEV